MSFKNKFSNLGQPRKIWVVAAVHGACDRLVTLHKTLFDKITSGDRLLYTGNYLCGPNSLPIKTIDEVLHFRRSLLAKPGMQPEDFIYLRGIQEELWGKLLQLQFMPSPRQVIDWMQQKHPEMEHVLNGYGSSFDDASRAAREGVLSMTKWTSALKLALRQNPGHEKFFSILHRAAFTECPASNDNLLFVHAGLDPQLPLVSQGDNFWWASRQFSQIQETYHPFKSVIRGFDPDHQGLKIGPSTISLDGGGQLLCAEMSGHGDVLEILAA
jgi:hypothetical protein